MTFSYIYFSFCDPLASLAWRKNTHREILIINQWRFLNIMYMFDENYKYRFFPPNSMVMYIATELQYNKKGRRSKTLEFVAVFVEPSNQLIHIFFFWVIFSFS